MQNLDALDRVTETFLPVADTVLDLSNVLRSGFSFYGHRASTGKASLEPLALLFELWKDHFKEEAKFVAIADQSLRHNFQNIGEQQRYEQWLARGLVREVPYADPIILDVAEGLNASVFSNDQYRSFRRERPWMNVSPERFLHFGEHKGEVAILRGLSPAWDPEVSIAEENDELHSAIQLRDLVTKFMGSRWACANRACATAQWAPGLYPFVPLSDSGAFACQFCHSALEAKTGDPESVLVKVVAGEDSPMQLRLHSGDQVSFGRGSDGVIPVGGFAQESSLLSRHHFDLRYYRHRLEARDAGSMNGVRVLRWDPKRGSLQSAGRLSENWSIVTVNDLLELPGSGLYVRQSGRRFPGGRKTRVQDSFTRGEFTRGDQEIPTQIF